MSITPNGSADMSLTTELPQASFARPFATPAASGWLAQAQAQAREALGSLEVPSRRWEAWKYTDLRPWLKREYPPAPQAQPASIEPFLLPGWEGDRMVWVNGQWSEALSDLSRNQGALVISRLSALEGEEQARAAAQLGALAGGAEGFFSALNLAYAREGLYIRVPEGVQAPAPIHLIHLSDASLPESSVQERSLILLDPGASLEVIETFRTLGPGAVFANSVAEIQVAESASLRWARLQEESAATLRIDRSVLRQQQGSKAWFYTLSFGGELLRNETALQLAGPQAEGHLLGAYLLEGVQHVDNYTQVEHQVPDCFSNELYKGVLSGNASAAFTGRIHVHRDAQKTNAYQSNRNILLSDTANVYTRPQLEIYADDVKCSHGAATGRLDDKALFYLRARGIPEAAARLMMLQAFVGEVFEGIENEALRAYLEQVLEKRFG